MYLVLKGGTDLKTKNPFLFIISRRVPENFCGIWSAIFMQNGDPPWHFVAKVNILLTMSAILKEKWTEQNETKADQTINGQNCSDGQNCENGQNCQDS